MASSYALYTGDGVQTDWTVPSYLDKSHIAVYVNGVLTAFSWLNANTVRVSPAAASGTHVLVQRTTTNTSLVSFSDTGNIFGKDLNLADKQALYRAIEAAEKAARALSPDEATLNWDGANKRVINAADPVNDQDVVNKRYGEANYPHVTGTGIISNLDNRLSHVADPQEAQDATTVNWVNEFCLTSAEPHSDYTAKFVRIKDVGDPTADQDAVNKRYGAANYPHVVDSETVTNLNRRLSNVADPQLGQDATTVNWIDGYCLTSHTPHTNYSARTVRIIELADPVDPQDATTKAWVESWVPANSSRVRSGPSNPSDALGNNGDTYVNSTTGDYFIKASGTWGARQGNLKGPQGVPGEGTHYLPLSTESPGLSPTEWFDQHALNVEAAGANPGASPAINAAAIQWCIDNSPSGRVFFPGFYPVTPGVIKVTRNGITLFGANRFTSGIYSDVGAGDLLTVGENSVGHGDNTTITEMFLHAASQTSGSVIKVKGAQWVKIRSNNFYGGADHAIELGGNSFVQDSTHSFSTVSIEENLILGPRGGHGIFCNTWWQDVFICHNTITGGPDASGYAGIYSLGTGGIVIIGNNVYPDCDKIILDSAFWATLSGNFILSNSETATRVGLHIKNGRNNSISGNNFHVAGVGLNEYAIVLEDTSHNSISGGSIDSDGTTPTGAIVEVGTSDYNSIVGVTLSGPFVATVPIYLTGAHSQMANNPGCNPVGNLTGIAPTLPATGGTVTNTMGVAATIYIGGGSGVGVSINGHALPGSPTMVRLLPSQTLTISYSSAPTWVWYGE